MSLRLAGALTVAALALTGCNDDGRALTPAPEVPVSELTVPSASSAARTLRLTSPTMIDGGVLPVDFTCDGTGVAPTLDFSEVDASILELAIVVIDPDADDYIHWIVAGLPPSLTRLGSGALPPAAVPAATTGGIFGWEPACPPPGAVDHRYRFTVYGAAEPIGLSPGLAGSDALEIIEAAAVQRADLTVTYGRAADG